jgi:hypothetical protein
VLLVPLLPVLPPPPPLLDVLLPTLLPPCKYKIFT